ncbi:hypothetical protein RND71_001613 [Anisodus tanguticus]|uniref:Glycerol-3-phosphate dehydrogenase NAD-dependent N-terminal domain-containing protein n=1 Tax=Anisodus tanguticus TaxID=243964 RepID=A0AAE1VVZ5_9SOLA|nr:hypothetical protein RND71_001613 [Anisodus tanguticus]
MLQDAYGNLREKVQIRIWRRAGRDVDKATAEYLFEVINSREDVLRRMIRRCAYLKTLHADEILKYGFCSNMIDTPLCPLKVVTNLQEAVWDADIVIDGLPSTETREERITVPVTISLAKGIEAELRPEPRILEFQLRIYCILGGPNIASEIYNREYVNARICGAEKWRKALARFLRQPHFIVWDNGDLVTHEVMGGLKNVYAIGAGAILSLSGAMF